MDNVTKLEVRMAETTNGDGMAAASVFLSTPTDGESGGGSGDHAVNGSGGSGGDGGNTNGQDSLVLDASTLVHLQAAAFRSLCRHLEERSDLVSNMDLMSVSGFCRNCLAKVRVFLWAVLLGIQRLDTRPLSPVCFNRTSPLCGNFNK
jgi:Protein of unknown function (DUF1244)